MLTEAGTQRRASLHLLEGRAALAAMDPGGIDVMTSDLAAVRRPPRRREPHREAGAHDAAALQRHRQRVFRRDPAPGPDVAARP
jgi:hypothetical protein